MNLNQKTVLITGASSGIGEALALEFARQKSNVVLFARRKERLEGLVRTIESMGARALAVSGDVNVSSDLELAVRETVAKFERIDIVVANAGFGVVGKFEDLSIQDFERQFETNVFGLLKTIKAALPELKKSKGQIALMGSITSYFSAPNSGAYSMSKFAVRAFAQSLSHEIAKSGVGVTLITPGLIQSELRKVDNKGVFHQEAKNKPTKLHMPAQTAAKKMVRAIACRRREVVITLHGKGLVFLAKHLSWLLNLFFKFGLKGRGSVEL